MVNFNPNIYYSNKASEAKERYQEAKKKLITYVKIAKSLTKRRTSYLKTIVPQKTSKRPLKTNFQTIVIYLIKNVTIIKNNLKAIKQVFQSLYKICLKTKKPSR